MTFNTKLKVMGDITLYGHLLHHIPTFEEKARYPTKKLLSILVDMLTRQEMYARSTNPNYQIENYNEYKKNLRKIIKQNTLPEDLEIQNDWVISRILYKAWKHELPKI